MDRYGVMGNPVKHSQSPLIHRLFAEQTAEPIQYHSYLVEMDGLAEALDQFQASGGKGLNITLPFKHRAFGLVNSISDRALLAEVVNTIVFNEDGSRFGDITDGCGLMRDIICNQGFSIENKRVLVLGAGGAVRGVIDPLLHENPSELVIANRTASKAFALIENFIADVPLIACGLSDLSGQTFDLVINGTSASLQGEIIDLPPDLLNVDAFCYDMVYGKGHSPFLEWARSAGAARYQDGLGMLIEQAAESFYLFRGVKPDTKQVFSYFDKFSEAFP